MSETKSRRTVLITGASAGLGEAIALACAQEGWRLALGARRLDRLEDVARRARDLGAQVYAGPLDVGQEASVETFFGESETALGIADVIVNNAGLSKPGLLHHLERREAVGFAWKRILHPQKHRHGPQKRTKGNR